MSVRHHNWYNQQETRQYPVDENATGVDDSGLTLADDTLVDLKLRFIPSLASYAFISGLTVTDSLVTVVILGAASLDSAGDLVPLAAINLSQPVDEYRPHQLQALSPGVSGHIVFGGGLRENQSYRFSGPSQALLAPKAARTDRSYPVASLGKQNRETALQGLVGLQGTGPLQIVKETVEIAGTEREALVFRLRSDFAGINPLEDFIGPCGGRPESQNCNKPAIVEVGGVEPDCNGNLDIEFLGITTAAFKDCGGLALDLDLDIAAACDVPSPYRSYLDDCEPLLSSQAEFESSLSSEVPPEESVSLSSESLGCNAIPMIETFDIGAPNWLPQTGDWDFEAFDSPSESQGSSESSEPIDRAYVAKSSGIQNVSIMPDCTDSTLERSVTTDLQLTGINAQRNGGVVINYHLVESPLRYEFYMVLMDYLTNTIEVLRWTGTTFITEFSTGAPKPIKLNDWYRMNVEVTAGPGAEQATISVTVRGITDNTWPHISFDVVVNNLLPDDGSYGLGSINAKTRFSFFELKPI